MLLRLAFFSFVLYIHIYIIFVDYSGRIFNNEKFFFLLIDWGVWEVSILEVRYHSKINRNAS